MLIVRRRTFVINRNLQLSMLLTSLDHIGLLVLVVSTALFAPLILQLLRPDWTSTETSDAALQILYLHQRFWLPVALTFVAIALHSIVTSHRIAGPVFRIRQVCEAMVAGVIPKRVTLRKNDRLKPEMDVVNTMLDTWHGLIAGAQHDVAALDKSLAAYSTLEAAGHDDPAAEAVWADIVRSHQRLRETLGWIALEGKPDGSHAAGSTP